MSDTNEEQVDVEESSEQVSSGKGKGVGNLLPTLLKWVAIVLGAIILIVTVVIVTMKVIGGNKPQQAIVPISEEYVKKSEVLDWYTSLPTVKTRTNDPIPASVLVDIALGYKTGDKVASTEITQRQIEIGDFLRRFFSQKTAEELNSRYEDKIRIEIRNSINDDILSNSKIRDVRFRTYDIIAQ